MKKPWLEHSPHDTFRKTNGARSSAKHMIGPPSWLYRPSENTHPADVHLIPEIHQAIWEFSEKHGVHPALLTGIWGAENQGSSNPDDETKFLEGLAPHPHYAIRRRASDGKLNVSQKRFHGLMQMSGPATIDAFGKELHKRLNGQSIEHKLLNDPAFAIEAAARYLQICRTQAEKEAEALQAKGKIITPRQVTLATIHGYNKGPYTKKHENQDNAYSFTGRTKWDYPGRTEENFFRLGGDAHDFETAFSFNKSFTRNKKGIAMNWFTDSVHPSVRQSGNRLQKAEEYVANYSFDPSVGVKPKGLGAPSLKRTRSYEVDGKEIEFDEDDLKGAGISGDGPPSSVDQARLNTLMRLKSWKEKIRNEEKRQGRKIHREEIAEEEDGVEHEHDHGSSRHERKIMRLVEKLRHSDICPKCGCNPCRCEEREAANILRRMDQYEKKTKKVIDKEENAQKKRIHRDHTRPGVPKFVAKYNHGIDKHARKLKREVEELRAEEKHDVKEEMEKALLVAMKRYYSAPFQKTYATMTAEELHQEMETEILSSRISHAVENYQNPRAFKKFLPMLLAAAAPAVISGIAGMMSGGGVPGGPTSSSSGPTIGGSAPAATPATPKAAAAPAVPKMPKTVSAPTNSVAKSSAKHKKKRRYPSFDVQSSEIARREGVSEKAADAILASRARNH